MDIVILHKMVKKLNLWPWFTEWIENKSKEDQQALYDAVERRYNLKNK
jgi:hypothetical protein